MFDRVADRNAEGEEHNLCDGEKPYAECDISNWPAVVQRSDDDNELRNNVCYHANQRPDDVYDPKAEWFIVLESGEALECRN